MAAYFFASPIDVDIKLEGEELRRQVEIKTDKEKVISCPVYYDGDSVGGQVRARSLISLLSGQFGRMMMSAGFWCLLERESLMRWLGCF